MSVPCAVEDTTMAFNGFAIPTDPNNPDTEWFEGGKPVLRLVD